MGVYLVWEHKNFCWPSLHLTFEGGELKASDHWGLISHVNRIDLERMLEVLLFFFNRDSPFWGLKLEFLWAFHPRILSVFSNHFSKRLGKGGSKIGCKLGISNCPSIIYLVLYNNYEHRNQDRLWFYFLRWGWCSFKLIIKTINKLKWNF